MDFFRKLLKKNEDESESFDVELSYIAPRIIIIGSCSEEAEKQSCSELKRFLDCFHKGYYKVFDLCEEGCYVPAKFHDKVTRFPITKERPPSLDVIKNFCVAVDNWLISHDNNVVVIFEKKKDTSETLVHRFCTSVFLQCLGRTSVLLASYLVYSELVQDALTALEYYAFQRTGNIKVKASPSKQRYVAYFERMRRLEHMGLKLQSNELRVEKITISGLQNAKKLCKLRIIDGTRTNDLLHVEVIEKTGAVIKFNKKCVISADTIFQFYFENKTDPQIWLWINSSFYGATELVFNRKTIDCEGSKFRKKNLSPKFRLTIDIQVESEGSKTWNEENRRIASKTMDYILSESIPDTASSLSASSEIEIDIDNVPFEEDLVSKEILVSEKNLPVENKRASYNADVAVAKSERDRTDLHGLTDSTSSVQGQRESEIEDTTDGPKRARRRSASGRKLIERDSPSEPLSAENLVPSVQKVDATAKESATVSSNTSLSNDATMASKTDLKGVDEHVGQPKESTRQKELKTVLSMNSVGSPSSRKFDTIRRQRRKLGEKITKRDTIGASKIPELKKMMTLALDNAEETLVRVYKYLSTAENRFNASEDALLSLYRISNEIIDVADTVQKSDFDVFEGQGSVLTPSAEFKSREDNTFSPYVEDVIEKLNICRKSLISLKNEIAIAAHPVRLITYGRLVRYIKVVLESTDIKEICAPAEEDNAKLEAEQKLKRLIELMKQTRNSIVQTLDNMISQIETSANIEDALRIASSFKSLKKKVQEEVDAA